MEYLRKLNDHIADAVENIALAAAEVKHMIAKEEGEQLAAVGDASFAAPNMSTVVRLCQLYHERMMKDWMSDGRTISDMSDEESRLRTSLADFILDYHAPTLKVPDPVPDLKLNTLFVANDRQYRVTEFATNLSDFAGYIVINAHEVRPTGSDAVVDGFDVGTPDQLTPTEPSLPKLPILIKFVFELTMKNNTRQDVIEYGQTVEDAEKVLYAKHSGLKNCVCRGIAAV